MDTYVGPDETATGLVVNIGDRLEVYFGAINNTTVFGGFVTVHAGTATNTVINGGTVYVEASTVASGVVLNGGTLNMETGKADNLTINNGGRFSADYVVAPDSIHNVTVNDGGTIVLHGYGPNAGVTDLHINSGGTLAFAEIYEPHSDFVGYSDLHLASGASIDFGRSFLDPTISLDKSTNTLVVASHYHNGNDPTPLTQTFSVYLTGDYSTATFQMSEDSRGDLVVTAENVCFCRGTLIRTPCGDIPVEELRVGDEVETAGGPVRPIRWIGTSAALVNDGNRPVVVRAGALAEHAPSRDLYVTRGHSFLLGDILVPIGELVNGTTIAWDEGARTIEVYHLELDVHAVLIANGAEAESYRDDGNRQSFSSVTGAQRPSRSMPTCAPVVTTGPILDRARRRLAARAAAQNTARPSISDRSWPHLGEKLHLVM